MRIQRECIITNIAASLIAALLVAGAGCGIGRESGDGSRNPEDDELDDGDVAMTDDELKRRPSSFLSADWPYYPRFSGEEEEEEEEEEERELEEGDIYRVLGGGYLLNLNAYRGLQVIDIRDPAKPAVVGQLRVSGTPVEMYVVGTRAIALYNDWFEYRRKPGSIDVEQRRGATAMLIDFSNYAAPRLVSQQHVDGYIRTSRLARDSNDQALYLASTHYALMRTPSGDEQYRPVSIVTSFGVGDERLIPRSKLTLSGDVSAIHAEASSLLVARDVPDSTPRKSAVSLIDIASTDGTMALRGTALVQGYVRSQFHMDLHDGMIRVVSGPQFNSSSSASFIQTFDASDPNNIVPIDTEEFGRGQSIFAAVFLPDRAFAVTYLRTDPFHAFAIEPNGNVTEKSEFIVSGWNDFFRPVLDSTRLIGIGVDDASGRRQLAVSLYDITKLENPDPLVARTVVSGTDEGWNWSEASWDHRAFTVLDNAVSTTSPTGVPETGLVLLPFNSQHYDGRSWQLTSAVQIFTYSNQTLTRRGVMDHGSPVRRAFPVSGAPNTAANLSDVALTLYDHSDLEQPRELGRTELAADFIGIYAFGDYRVRIRNPSSYWIYDEKARAIAEVIPQKGPAERVAPLATFEVPLAANRYQVGNRLVSVSSRYDRYPTMITTIEVVDLANPLAPEKRTPLVTTALPSPYGREWNDRFLPTIYATNNALAFVNTIPHRGASATVRRCFTYVRSVSPCAYNGKADDCTYFAGRRECQAVDGKPAYCNGGFAHCTDSEGGSTKCSPTEDAAVDEYCDEFAGERQSVQVEAMLVDVGAAPSLAGRVTLPVEDEGVSAFASKNALYVTVKQPTTRSDDSRPHARYYVRRVDTGALFAPTVGPRINVPGEVIDVSSSENTMFTRDPVWGRQFIESALARVTIADGAAYLRNYHRFPNRAVEGIAIDEHRTPVVIHDRIWDSFGDTSTRELEVLGTHAPGRGGAFKVLSDDRLTIPWASLTSAAQHRVFLEIEGGRLMLDITRPQNREARAFFWYAYGETVVDHGEVLMNAGRFGIHQLALSASNMRELPSEEPSTAVKHHKKHPHQKKHDKKKHK